MISNKIKIIYEKVVDIVFGIILAFLVLGIVIGAVQLFTTSWGLFKLEGITGHYIDLITDVLTLYVLIELSRSLVEYFSTNRFRLDYIIDAAIVFVIREVLIGLFKHELESQNLYALSVFLLVLGMIRIGSIFIYQREKRISSESST